jgi:hypothetical protein
VSVRGIETSHAAINETATNAITTRTLSHWKGEIFIFFLRLARSFRPAPNVDRKRQENQDQKRQSCFFSKTLQN